jgi:hypothetical protein
MREPIMKERAAECRDVSININTTKLEHPADKKRLTDGYDYESYRIHETFDPDGPTFKDCIVRVFAGQPRPVPRD